MKRRLLLWISLLLNVFLLLCFWMALQRLGGWNYTLFRLQQDETGLYHSRKQLFERMPTQQGAVIFLGDSQTEQCEWQEFLQLDSVLVLNRGIVGDHVNGVLSRLDEITRHKPSKIFLLVGINDLIFESHRNHLPQYRRKHQECNARFGTLFAERSTGEQHPEKNRSRKCGHHTIEYRNRSNRQSIRAAVSGYLFRINGCKRQSFPPVHRRRYSFKRIGLPGMEKQDTP